MGTNEEDIINEEIRSIEKLKFLSEKEKSLQNELNRLLEDFKALSDEEKKFWDDYSNLETNIHLYESFKSNIKNKMFNMEKEIKTYSNKNIFNELFNITFTEKYGLINGCRIGMIWPIDTNMEIDEINSGWGLIIHLTVVISNKFNFESNKYELYPMGSFSKIMSKESKTVGELIYSPNKPIERLNEAIVMYLEYVQELNEFLIKKRFITSKSYFFNFVIKEDSINDFCIKYDSNNIEGCAQGMKYLLVILKSYIDAALKLEHDQFKDIVERSAIINNK